jgi:tRNA modification GTPase
VTPVPGTTRDLVTESLNIGGIAVTLVDTAGWRETLDAVEFEGVSRGNQARRIADLVLLVLDGSEALTPADEQLLAETALANRIVVSNKSDIRCDESFAELPIPARGGSIQVSALTGDGFDRLHQAISRTLVGDERLRDAAAISNTRHISLLEQCRGSLVAARDAATAANVPEEFLLTDLQAARASLDEIVGRRTSEDVLRHIFERFCIGK